MTIAVQEYTLETAHQILADARARRARLYRPGPDPVAPKAAEPTPLPFIPLPDHVRDWISLATPQATRPGASTRIIAIVADAFSVTRLDLISERRTAKIVLPRQICFYLMRHCTTLSFPEIGRRMGGRDHTTALHGVAKIERLLLTQPHLRVMVEDLAARVRADAIADAAELLKLSRK